MLCIPSEPPRTSSAQPGGDFASRSKRTARPCSTRWTRCPGSRPVTHATTDRGHGRITTRTIQVLPAPDDLPFPHVSQVHLIERHVSALDGTPLSEVAALGVTSLTVARATLRRLAALVRSQWAIESLHWLRDTLYQEDNSTVRTRSGPRIMAALSNLAIGALHLAGRTTPPKPPDGPAAA